MSTAEHYFQLHGLQADAPEKLNEALQAAIGQLETTIYGSTSSELTVNEVAMLERAGVDLQEHPKRSDPMMGYATEFAAILATSLTPAQVAKTLALTPVRVRQLIREGSLYAIRIEGRWHVPVFQLDGAAMVPNIGQVNEQLAGLDAVSVMRWYTTRDPELENPDANDLTPLEWLKTGRGVETLLAIVPDA